MLTLLINETKPLAGLFASATGGIGSVPDISVADEGQAVSVQTFTRTAGVITDSFVAGDVLHIGIGDGVNAPVCYIELSSASPATGTMPINTAGMVALFAATVANQLKLTVGVVRTRGGSTNTIFSAPIVIHRSVINIATAVPTPSILGTGVAAALQVAINTAMGFVRLDASARLPAVDGSQLTNLPGGGGGSGTVTSVAQSFTGGLISVAGSPITASGTLALTVAGTSGGIPYFSSGTTWATSAALAANALVVGGGAGAAPATVTTGANVLTALGIAVGSAGAFITFDGDAGTPSVLVGTNISGTAANLTAGLVSSIGSLTGDVTSSNRATTLATVNSNVGSFTNASLTVNAKGLVTAASSGTAAVTSITGTANEITVTGTTTPTLSLPSALTFTDKTVTGGTFTGGAFNGTVGATTPDTVAGTTGTFDSTVTVGANSQAGTLNIKNSSGTTTAFISGSDGSAQFGDFGGNIGLMIDPSGNITTGNNADASLYAFYAKNFAGNTTASINGSDGSGSFASIELGHATDTTLARVSAGVVSIEGATILVNGGDAGTPSAIVLTNASGTASININGTVGATTPSTIAGTTGTFSGVLSTTGDVAEISTYGASASIITYGGGHIQTSSTFKLDNDQYITSLSHAPTTDRFIALPDATGTLALTSDITGGTRAGSFTTLTASSTTSLLLGTAGSAVGTIGFRNATSGTTTLAPATGALGTGTVTLPLSGTLATLAGTETLTNKRITQRSGTAASSATPTINTDNVDFYSLTAQAADITSFTTNLSGTPTEGQTLWIAITGTAARAITWGATFEAGAVALPTTTVSTDRLDVAFVWNTVTSKWRCMASG
jgi:hypothetical protein